MATDLDAYRAAERRLWARVGAAPTDRFVTLATGERVRVQELGEGPPFVLIHGGSVAGTSWATLVAALDGVRCLMVDRPGCGLSDPVAGGSLADLPAFKAYTDRLLPDLLDALELDRSAVGATSYGGICAFRGAAAAPDRVTRLVEYSWPMGAPAEGAPLMARMSGIPGVRSLMARMPMPRPVVKSGLRQFGMGRAIDSGAFDDQMLDWAYALLRHTDTMLNETRSSPRLFTPIRGQNDDLLLTDDELARLTMPVMFLWGADDPNGGESVAREFAPRLPDSELVVLPGAEHAPWLDDLEACVEHTRRFLLAP